MIPLRISRVLLTAASFANESVFRVKFRSHTRVPHHRGSSLKISSHNKVLASPLVEVLYNFQVLEFSLFKRTLALSLTFSNFSLKNLSKFPRLGKCGKETYFKTLLKKLWQVSMPWKILRSSLVPILYHHYQNFKQFSHYIFLDLFGLVQKLVGFFFISRATVLRKRYGC